MFDLNLPQNWMESCGSFSLEGCLAEKGVYTPQPVTLWFEQAQREPDVILVPDYAPACFAASILNLISKGFTLEIKTYPKGSRK